jgi:protein TonB
MYVPAGPRRRTAAGVALVHAAIVALILSVASQVERIRDSRAYVVSILSARTEPVKLTAQPKPPPMALRPIAPVSVPPPLIATLPVADLSATPIVAAAVNESPRVSPTQVSGAAVTPPRFDADYLDNPPPVYPRLSKRLNEAGNTLLMVHVDADGLPVQVALQSSSGYQRLDQAAIEAVRRWRFIAAKQGDKSVAAWVVVPIHFALKP